MKFPKTYFLITIIILLLVLVIYKGKKILIKPDDRSIKQDTCLIDSINAPRFKVEKVVKQDCTISSQTLPDTN